MSAVRCITLANPGPIISTFVQIHYRVDSHELEITAIEIHADAEATQLIADGISVDDLPRSSQEEIYAALAARVGKRRREHGLRRLLTDVQLLSAELRP
jgi:hypothetical protein